MSGDHGLRSSITATINALNQNSALHISLVGDEPSILLALAQKKYNPEQLQIHHSPDIVAMDEIPSKALRYKKQSSMYRVLEMLRDGHVSGVISAGNTGALVAMSCIVLKRLSGVSRPAICAPIPAQNGYTLMLDLGANISCDAAQLYQFAVMGASLSKALGASDTPRLALLNIGAELIKGPSVVKEAAELISADPRLNYVGFAEGNDIFSEQIDVVVCDGFTGNVALKVCEGTASFIRNQLKTKFEQSIYGRLSAILAMPVLKAFQGEINPDRYNGAALLGLNGVVIKSHGSSGVESFESAIHQAALAVSEGVTQSIGTQIGTNKL
ncbi:Phosphate acyltransferase [Zhongshania aliphaticivorans]|uniref:Phosphate acyltransferase n=2 Tax=Zhongshania aliphaticivorans TaxID=1470434 RepID=A0A5S9NZ14_9GAMM|nr:Phosphate acyltransferase [Zhongshania aliphaticivorans]CAA0096145.1 Phosphate acyltransferase [Zhongshania aliphaticivorans]